MYIFDGSGSRQVFRAETGTNMVSYSGQITQRLMPLGSTTTDDASCGWPTIIPESAAVTLTEDLVVDMIRPSAIDDPSDDTPGVIPAGTRVTSYLIHGLDMRNLRAGTATFERQILGLQYRKPTLDAGDPALAIERVEYVTAERGIEESTGDRITLRNDRRRVEQELAGFFSPGSRDHIRVIVESDGTDELPIFIDTFDCRGRTEEWDVVIGDGDRATRVSETPRKTFCSAHLGGPL